MDDSKRGAGDLLDQHRRMVARVEELRDYLALPRPEPGATGAARWSAGLLERLDRLHGEIVAHFRDEEGYGLLDELSRKRPHLGGPLKAFQKDHRQILDGFRSLLAAAREYGAGHEPDDPQLRRRGLDLLDHLARHEHGETELLQRAFYQESGTAD